MRNSLLMFILGVLTIVLLGFETIKSDILTVEPATPKYYSVQYETGNDMNDIVKSYMKNGYLIHSTFTSGQSGYVTVVFVKY